MNFTDYGIVDWFDCFKDVGVVKTAYNGDVFISERNNIDGIITKGSYVFIEYIEVSEQKEGINTIVCDFELFLEKVFQYWVSKKDFICNIDVKWLINNGNDVIINKVIEINKQNWLLDKCFIDEIRKSISSYRSEIKKQFLFDVCQSNQLLKYENIEWLLFRDMFDHNDSIDMVKKLAQSCLKYDELILEKIYSSLFPNNDKNFFLNKAISSSWSNDFRVNYIAERRKEKKIEFSDLFSKEFEVQRSGLIKKISIRKETHAATDLANFAFCPASYIISQTYNIDFIEQDVLFIGTQEHKKQRLINLSDSKRLKEDKITKSSLAFYNDFKRILNADSISQGHKDSKPAIYYSKNKKISGIPDYIFKDIDGYFAVEEKYTFKKYEDLTALYFNHKIQALAYLYGLVDFQFDEVYILYWFIQENEEGNYQVYNYKLFKITKTEDNKRLILDTFYKLESIQNREQYPFPSNQINYNKCVKCNYFPYCEYKKGDKPFVELLPLNTSSV